MRLRPSSLPRPSRASGSASTRAHIPPTVRQSTRISSAGALLHMWSASHSTVPSNALVNLLAAPRARGTASALTPCSGHSTLLGACSA